MTSLLKYSLFFVLFISRTFAQDTTHIKKSFLPITKVDDKLFDAIFGTYCPDSIVDPFNHKRTYILGTYDHYNYITAYKSAKKKWSYQIADLISVGDNYVNIKCIEFYEVNKKMVIRLFLDTFVLYGDKKIYHVDINPKNGKPVDKTLTKK
jgi:hypothetical protein